MQLLGIIFMLFECYLSFFQCFFNFAHFCRFKFIFVFANCFFNLKNQAIQMVSFFYRFARLLICSFIFFCFAHHAFNFIFAQSAAAGDCYLLLFAGCFIFCRYMHNTIGINIK